MPTTSYISPTMAAATLGARTDPAGAPVEDLTAEENRLLAGVLTPGYITRLAFVVSAQDTPDMTVKVGSGNAKTDLYVVAGTVAGQGNYLARLDVPSVDVAIDAADSSQERRDGLYLVVRDDAYDSSGVVTPQLAYRKGDLGGGNPEPDSTWRASEQLATVVVSAGATEITEQDVLHLRAPARLAGDLAGPPVECGVARNDTARANSTTLISTDSGLLLGLEPGETYLIDGWIEYSCANDTELKLGWSTPSAVSGRWSPNGTGPFGTQFGGVGGSIDTATRAWTETAGLGPGEFGVTDRISCRPTGVITNGGDATEYLWLRFAQHTAGATPVTIYAGSWLRATRT